jgi:DNA polymerase III subunit delta
MHATEILSAKETFSSVPVIVLYGTERYLKLEVLKKIPGCHGEQESDASLTRVAGKDADFRNLMTELMTVSMFGDQRIVLVEDADEFVTAHRPALEKYVARPAKSSILILDMKTFQKTTKLFKAVESVGLAVECSELTGAVLIKWIRRIAEDEYGKTLDRDAAALVVQLAGDSLGLLQQEIGKLASLVGDSPAITTDDVTRVVGGWRLETTWEMLAAVRDNHVDKAIDTLDHLILAGEAPQRVLGATTYTFRKLAEATEAARTGTPLAEALRRAGVRPADAAPTEQYLRRMGYERASRILQWLAEADHDMKGGSRVDPKILLERLFMRLSGV